MQPSSSWGVRLGLALLLTACTATPSLQPAATPLAPSATASILTATALPTEARAATLGAPSRTVAPTNTSVPLSSATGPSPTEPVVPTATLPSATPRITLTVTMENYRFKPSVLSVRAGETIRLELKNPDRLVHVLAIPDASFSESISPGTTDVVDFVVDLTPGSYYLYCPVVEEGSHEELGMVGTVVVEAVP